MRKRREEGEERSRRLKSRALVRGVRRTVRCGKMQWGVCTMCTGRGGEQAKVLRSIHDYVHT